ncbi:pectin lyase fold/virulence factor [Gilbertella persicaria]|uniref:pectin lyase fold/virulence factor n=1 Tax=Gilbertella persicaria TaxID=101096 RepID=UPI00222018B4|nr:pectin lyase fold/virulence factor [Gilbertella persicaria]KAI8078185.1 pectin lyase fold/virulence factor [Gilbertella persicaria]
MQLSLGPLLLLFTLAISLVSAANSVSVCSSCTYKTISAALKALPSGSTTYTINIAPGTYTEQISITRSNVILKNSGSGTVLIQYNAGHDTQSKTGSDTDSAVLTIKGSNVKVYNITFANTYKKTDAAGLALNLEGAQAGFYNAKFYGFQDTLLINRRGSGYFKKCYIEGSVDFIWGYGIGYFQGCIIASNSRGFVTAHNRDSSSSVGGFYFNKCIVKATVPSGPLASNYSSTVAFTSISQATHTCYLGRPWNQYARVVFMYSTINSHIYPAGWSQWSNATPNTSSVTFAEYSNNGASAWSSSRASFAKQLTASEAAQYSAAKVFGSTSWIDSSV